MTMAATWPQVTTELPGPRSAELFVRFDAVSAAPMTDHDEVPFVEARKSGSLIEDVDGNVFADLVSSWGSTPYGASPEAVVEAVIEAQRRYGMEITNYVQNEAAYELAEKLVAIAPPGITRVMPSLSGTLAVEAGVKLARESTGRPMILVFHGQYHGEGTYLTASVSTDLAEVTSHSSAYVGGVAFAPYPNRFRAPFHRGPGPYDDTLYVDYIEDWLLVHQVEPDQVAGVLIEPVLGEGGIHVPSQAFWDRLTALCRRWGWKLILDEVQTGMGRCGTVFAAERWGLEPDILLLGKGIAAGGQPIAAVLATEEIMVRTDVHGAGTFAWTPAACAGASAGIDVLTNGETLANVTRLEEIGERLLVPLVDEVEQVGDVRMLGAFMGIEFVTDKASISPAPEFHRAVHLEAVKRGVLGVTQFGKWVYRLQPALTMPPELFEWCVEQLVDVIRTVSADPPREASSLLERVAPEGGTKRR
ncbi:MAG: aminotransferase class III-fold pyridoxal phosphate-dependent enzyme [Nocardioides sp.]